MKRPPEFEDLPQRKRRLLLLRAVLRPVLTTLGLVAAYCLLPLDQSFSAGTVAVLVVGLLAVVALVVWQTRSITRSLYPRLKGIEALATVFPLFVLLFAATYFLMERSQSSAFSESLTRMDAVYFTVTVFSTVGFGDIVPRTEAARSVVLLQMLGDVVLVGVAVRVILGAVRVGLDRRAQPASSGTGPAERRRRTNRVNRPVRTVGRLSDRHSNAVKRR